jgi:SAM-dependent methyltransferase
MRMPPYKLMYRLGFAPWERRDVSETWSRLLDGLQPGRALDVGCGTGRDAVHLAKAGWRVTAVDNADAALAKARARAAEQSVEVEWIGADVSELGSLGLEPGYTLVYDFGCIQDLRDAARAGAAAGVTQLAAQGATLLLVAFSRGRRLYLPRGMDEDEVTALLRDGWELSGTQSVASEDMPAAVRRGRPTLYRLTRK